MTQELKPCPFCGGAPLLIEGPYDYNGGDRWYYYSATFECTCGLTLEVMNTFPKVFHSSENALDFAIDAWNTRVERTCEQIDVTETRKPFTTHMTECSECGCVLALDEYRAPNYCPNCGAKVVDR